MKTDHWVNYVPTELKPRHKEVWSMLAFGLSIKEIADALRISTHTVEGHKYAVMFFFGITEWNLAFLVRLGVAFGLVDQQKPIP